MEGEQEKSARAAERAKLARERRKAYQAREAKEMAFQRRQWGAWLQMAGAISAWFCAAAIPLVDNTEYTNPYGTVAVGMCVCLWLFGAGLNNWGKV